MVYNFFRVIFVNLYEIFIDLGKIFRHFTKPRDEDADENREMQEIERRMMKQRSYVRK